MPVSDFKIIYVLLITSLIATTPITAWGEDGHQLIANIAYSILSPQNQQKACQILSTSPSNEQTCLGSIADWADEYKYSSGGGWSKQLHFVDVHDTLLQPYGCHYDTTDNCTFVYERDCEGDFCVVGAIANYTHRMMDKSIGDDDMSLKFLVHFIGDVHQPLHVSRGSDLGGNAIHVHFDDHLGHKGTNLHSVWDSGIIIRAFHEMNMNQTEYKWYLIHLLGSVYQDDVKVWLECSTDVLTCPSIWAEETLYQALKYAYSNEFHKDILDGDVISKEYYYRSIRIVEMQLLKGAVRLAALLEYILDQYDLGNVNDSFVRRFFSGFGWDNVASSRYIRGRKHF